MRFLKPLSVVFKYPELPFISGIIGFMETAALAAENQTLKGRIADQEATIERLQFDLAQLRKLVFGARSERRANLPDPDQLPLWSGVPEDAPRATPVTFKTVTTSPAQRQPKRLELPKHSNGVSSRNVAWGDRVSSRTVACGNKYLIAAIGDVIDR